MHDVVNAIIFLMGQTKCRGQFNLCAPEPIRYGDLATALGKAMGRPAFFRTPSFALRLLFGEMGDAILASQRAFPHRLLESGYRFRFKDINAALTDLAATAHPGKKPGKQEIL